MPSKTYYYMAAGTAIISISNTPSDLKILVEENKCGYNIPVGNPDKLADKILYLKNNKNVLNTYKSHSRQFAVNEVSKKKCIQKIHKLILQK